MALVAVAVLAFRRLDYDSPIVMLVETLLCTLALRGAVLATRLGSSNRSIQSAARASNTNPWVVILVSLAVVLPWVIDRIARSTGFGNDFEIVMLSSLAWGACQRHGLAIDRVRSVCRLFAVDF